MRRIVVHANGSVAGMSPCRTARSIVSLTLRLMHLLVGEIPPLDVPALVLVREHRVEADLGRQAEEEFLVLVADLAIVLALHEEALRLQDHDVGEAVLDRAEEDNEVNDPARA